MSCNRISLEDFAKSVKDWAEDYESLHLDFNRNEAALERANETNAKLNRRCQEAESKYAKLKALLEEKSLVQVQREIANRAAKGGE